MESPVAVRLSSLLLVAVPLAASDAVHAQTLDDVVPNAALEGDLVILEGTGLQDTTDVAVAGFVGGFAGLITKHVAPLEVTPTRVTFVVPEFNAFAGPDATPPSSPIGQVSVDVAAQSLPIFLMEETMGAVETIGTGTTQPGIGKPVISWVFVLGPPFAGNVDFTPFLENGAAGSLAFFGVSVPATEPYLPIGDGTIVLDLAQLFLFAGAGVVNAAGQTGFLLPIPAAHGGQLGVTIAAQFALVDPVSFALAVSNGLELDL